MNVVKVRIVNFNHRIEQLVLFVDKNVDLFIDIYTQVFYPVFLQNFRIRYFGMDLVDKLAVKGRKI